MQSPPPVSQAVAAPNQLFTSAERKRKQKERSKEDNEQIDKNALYGIVSSPLKDSARLTIKLSRMRSSDGDQSGEVPSGANANSDHSTDVVRNAQSSRTTLDQSQKFCIEEAMNCQQAPVRPSTKETGATGGVVSDDAEIDALSETERIEHESFSERERWNKEVQDKGEFLSV